MMAVAAELRTYYGLSSTKHYSITHETVTNLPGNLKQVHRDGRYLSLGSTKTLKFNCVVNLSDGRMKDLARSIIESGRGHAA